MPVSVLCLALSLPFWSIKYSGFFEPAGFLGRVGSITGNLAGFYIAGLVAVAAFAMERASLDDVIKTGKVSPDPSSSADRRFLTRREYVCYIFGYLTFCSLAFSILSVLATSIGQPIGKYIYGTTWLIFEHEVKVKSLARAISIFLIIAPLAHLLVTTGYGLYYLIEKIYEKTPKLKSKPGSDARITNLDTGID
ncbi:hypothetical protein [Sphingomonas sp. G-3-2-10]|uniref:hypothetical protein n=1 Tax=Sphingomonas sp. G-3-2-10 TaxID=2728838 RepID=UPI00146D8222|nr:hypothetical protein [Sphingomonas sp. G-3-2-10]NML06172.1 hypothetical protein [Sphingomonas sp. G-3-2-10]